MNDAPPQPTKLVRKTAYGRTSLFLPTPTMVMREVKCMGGIEQHTNACVYHVLPPAHEQSGVCCWHCCEPITGTPIPLPRTYDPSEKTYHVYGATCGPPCALAYVIEHTSFDRGQHINVLMKMLREVFHVSEPITAAPPRAALKRFGGIFDTTTRSKKTELSLIQPPFVSYCMIAEERATDDDVTLEESDSINAPPPPSMYAEYLQSAEATATPKRAAEPSRQGPMSKFVKK